MAQDKSSAALAERLHACAIHLLRRLRRSDVQSGVSAPVLSALSVICHAGPISLGDLATAEQVSAATMSRLATGLETNGLIERTASASDGRSVLLSPTRKGNAVLEQGRKRRIESLAEALDGLSAEQRRALEKALPTLEIVAGRR